MNTAAPLADDRVGVARGNWVDVRDVASIHVEALLKEEAGGERFNASAGPYTWQDFLDALNEAGVPDIPKGVPGAGKGALHNAQSGGKAERVLGIKFKTIAESAKDTVEAIRNRSKNERW